MDELFSFFDKAKKPVNFHSVRISLASPEKIKDWSNGEVKKPDSYKFEKDLTVTGFVRYGLKD